MRAEAALMLAAFVMPSIGGLIGLVIGEKIKRHTSERKTK
jgi:hypothetical protein